MRLYLENVSMTMIAWSKWVLGNIDVIKRWNYLSFINYKNASVLVAAMKKLYASRLTKCLANWGSGFG